jgi:PAS domain S-box-containing protein
MGIVLFLVTIWSGGVASGAGEPSRVLILFSNDRLLPANQRYDAGIRQALEPRTGEKGVNFFGEFLDATRMSGQVKEAALETYLRQRYEDLPPDVLVALGPEALRFLMERRGGLFPQVPVVFGGSSLDELDGVDLTGITGLPMRLSVVPVVKSLLEMRPETREIALVHGAADADRLRRDRALEELGSLDERIRVTDFPELPLDELKSALGKLSGEKAVLYLSYFQGPEGSTHTPADVAAVVSAAASVPVVGPYDTYVGRGVLGVQVSPFEEEGRELGEVIRRVLAGEKVAEIGVLPPSRTRLILDDRELRRWDIEEVPANAEVRFRQPPVWNYYRKEALMVGGVVVLQGLFISGLSLARRRQKRAEKGLRESEERFSGIFRDSPAPISIVRRADGRIVDVNPGWEEITGMPKDSAIGKTPLEAGMVVRGDDAEEKFRMFLESGKPLKDYEQVHRMPDGTTRVLSLTTELTTLRGEPCYIILGKDVTEPRAIATAQEELAHTSRLAMLGEMTASIAHEINQPLGAILSNTDAAEMLLERDNPPLEEVKLILADIRHDNRRASSVIKRVRSLVGRRDVQRVPLDLNDLLLESTRLVSHDARRRGVAVVHELGEGLPLLHIDPVQVEQVVINLLLNAMDAMKGTPVATRRLVVRSSRWNENEVMAAVEDCGHGIPEDKLGRVFDSFFTTKQGGMGLGLALARSIAEAHGGRLFAENNASKGATFYLILPANFPLTI